MGWENIFHCEWNEFGQKVLNYYWPNAISYGDITKTDFNVHRGTIDIITGGFPCQPFSGAGKRKGNKDDRHLWPEMLRAIREIQPGWIVGENVLGLLNWSKGLVFHEIQTDLEAAGYICFPYVLPACGKNAPHKRYRTWIIAYSKSNRDRRNAGTMGKTKIKPKGKNDGHEFNCSSQNVTNSHSNGQPRSHSKYEINTNEEWQYALNDIEPVINPDTYHKGLQRGKDNGIPESSRTDRDEQFAGLLQPNWQDFPTQPPLCGGNDGIPDRVDRIKALGNAIVPQVAYEIFKAIEQYEKINAITE